MCLNGQDYIKGWGRSTMKEILGLDEVRSRMLKTIQYMWDSEKDKARISLGIQPTILLYGRPGTGKTSLMSEIGEVFKSSFGEEDFRLERTDLNSFLSKNLGESSQNLSEYFEKLSKWSKQKKRVLVHLDDAESALISRGDDKESKGVFRFITTFLNELDSVISSASAFPPVIVISTNVPNLIDPAIVRRFTHRFKIDPKLNPEQLAKLCLDYAKYSPNVVALLEKDIATHYSWKNHTPHDLCRILEAILVQELSVEDGRALIFSELEKTE